MASQQSIFHAFLRPSILQILRATGYHSTRPAVLDSLTDLAARYLTLLCERTASHAAHNNHGDSVDFAVTDVRMALLDVGALLPERGLAEEASSGEEDVRGLKEFLKWVAGQRMKEMTEFANGDGESDGADYLNGKGFLYYAVTVVSVFFQLTTEIALKKKHSKAAEDTKYLGTILGKGNDMGAAEIQVEGGPETSITEWVSNRIGPLPQQNGEHNGEDDDNESHASSALSSVGDRLDDDTVMELS